MTRLRSAVLIMLLFLPACELIGLKDEEPQLSLTATSRSSTTLQLQWDAKESTTRYTVDYFTGLTTCDFPAMHSDVQQVTGTSVTLTGLTPATLYHIHVHDLPDYKESWNIIMIRTLESGVAAQAVTAADYTTC